MVWLQGVSGVQTLLVRVYVSDNVAKNLLQSDLMSGQPICFGKVFNLY